MTVEYAHIDKKLCEVANKLSRLPYLPSNLKEEKKKFFESDSYNPVFKYKKSNVDLEGLKKELLELEIVSRPIGELFKKKRAELLRIIDMMQSIGTSKLTQISKDLYGEPDKKLVDMAWRLISIHDVPDTLYLSSRQVMIHLQHALSKYGFKWKVKEQEMAARAMVSSPDKTLYIRKDGFFSKKFVKRLVVHEIGTHILRIENGNNQPYKIFSHGLAGYLGTEEGLAVLNEEMHQCLTKASLKTYAARVLAVHKGLKCTFRETYNYLVPHVGKENAFEVTFRAKRGLGNTFFPGAFTKDHLYLKGFFDVKKYLENGGSLQKLYYGKIGLKDIMFVEKIPEMVNPLFMTQMKYYADVVRYKKPKNQK